MVYGALRTGVELQLQLCRLASLDRLAPWTGWLSWTQSAPACWPADLTRGGGPRAGARTLPECFELFSAIHACTTTHASMQRVAREAAEDFAADGVVYLELRTTPKARRPASRARPDRFCAAGPVALHGTFAALWKIEQMHAHTTGASLPRAALTRVRTADLLPLRKRAKL